MHTLRGNKITFSTLIHFRPFYVGLPPSHTHPASNIPCETKIRLNFLARILSCLGIRYTASCFSFAGKSASKTRRPTEREGNTGSSDRGRLYERDLRNRTSRSHDVVICIKKNLCFLYIKIHGSEVCGVKQKKTASRLKGE